MEQTQMLKPIQADRELYRRLLSLSEENRALREKGEPTVGALELIARHRIEHSRADSNRELVEALTEVARDMREAAGKLREYGAVLSADILTAQAAKAERRCAKATGAA